MAARLVFLLLVPLTGCVSSLSTFQTARPIEPGHVQLSGGYGLYAPLGGIGKVIGQGIKQAGRARDAAQAKEPYQLTEEDQQDLLTAGIAIAVMPPSYGFETAARVGLVRNLDVGLRYSFSALKGDVKYRLLHVGETLLPTGQEDQSFRERFGQHSFDLAVGLGVSYYFFGSAVLEALDFLQVDDFARWDAEVPVYVSWEFGDILWIYGGPKVVLSRTWLDAKLVAAAGEASARSGYDVRLPGQVDTLFYGLTAGLGVGFRRVHVMLELTVGKTTSRPVLFGQARELGGLTLFPAVGLAIKI